MKILKNHNIFSLESIKKEEEGQCCEIQWSKVANN
jgi:hypothetical protein